MVTDQKQNMPNSRKDDAFVKAIIQKYAPYWPVFILLGALCLALAYMYGQWAEKSYEVKARILIKDEQKGIDESKMIEALDVFKANTIVENEIEVIQSRTLIRKVVKNLYLYAPIFRHEQSRKVSAFQTAPFRIQAAMPEKITDQDNITAVFDENTRQLTIQGKNYPLNQVVKTPWGELSFLSNTSYVSKPGQHTYSFSLIDIRKVEEGLAKSLHVNPVNRLASVVEISLNDSEPERGKQIINELIRLYVQAEIEEKNLLAGNILASVENRLQYVSGQLDSVENAIERYRSTAGIVDISAQGKLYLENVGQYDRQIQDVNIKMAVLDEVEKYVSSKQIGSGMIPSALGVDDPSLSQMLDRLNDAQFQYDKLKKTTGENSPILSSLSEQIATLRPTISEMIQNQRTSLAINRNKLESTGNRYMSMLSTIPHKEKQLIEISRQQSIKNQIYSFLLQRREEAALSYATTNPDSRIIDLAEASVKAVSPKKLFIYAGSLIGAFLLGLLFVEYREGMNKNVLFRKEIEAITSIPVIGEVFQNRKSNLQVFEKGASGKVAEQFRSIRNQLFYNNGSQNDKIIFITSFVKKEGKAFVGLNLASSMALAGKKVLIVDLDSNKQTITNHFSLQGKKGYTDLISSRLSVQDTVYRSAENAQLYIMPFGTSSENSDLFPDHQFVENLFADLRNSFDGVIFCSGPLSRNANDRRIATYCDKSLLVVRHGVTPKTALVAFANRQDANGLNSPAIVFNGIGKRGFAVKGYGDGLGYGYDLNSD
ncbi:GumC family protein [Flavihumibacter stibioxidans]|uniref:Capsular exopolysaccharide family n=1 Tax=Flavihumibacter stibioxidans TaxID=1834163 RepID=A0ABR7M610_9BACT|nr:tyrosine-protein kinase domain-containing protein [Flavihumibacter stibioxidans]MBC6489954.1 hypothetical protein [Flavihumibacter stibioxidans]